MRPPSTFPSFPSAAHATRSAAARPRVLALADAPAQPWRNGGGVTRELLAGPVPAAWHWRVSVAEVERDGPFSAFPGVQRWFAVVEGDGVELVIDGRAHVRRTGDAPLAFDGAADTRCRLLGGSTRDLNLMLRGARGGLRLAVAGQPWQPEPGASGGLFTAAACTLQPANGPALVLPAHALAWFDHLPERLQIEPPRSSLPAGGWWLWAAADAS